MTERNASRPAYDKAGENNRLRPMSPLEVSNDYLSDLIRTI